MVIVSSSPPPLNAHLSAGVCKLAPEVLDFEDFEEISDLAETSWVLSGTEVYHSGIAVHSDYPLNLDVVAMEMVVGVMVTGDGELHFFLGDEDMGCAATDIPSGTKAYCSHSNYLIGQNNMESVHHLN